MRPKTMNWTNEKSASKSVRVLDHAQKPGIYISLGREGPTKGKTSANHHSNIVRFEHVTARLIDGILGSMTIVRNQSCCGYVK